MNLSGKPQLESPSFIQNEPDKSNNVSKCLVAMGARHAQIPCKADDMKQMQRGFTLIELVMVIVILGILGTVAIPRFVDLSADARNAAVQGVAGALSSGSAINYATFSANNASTNRVTVNSCDTARGTLLGGAFPAASGGYAYSTTATAFVAPNAAPGSVNTCTLTLGNGTTSYTATFTAIAVP